MRRMMFFGSTCWGVAVEARGGGTRPWVSVTVGDFARRRTLSLSASMPLAWADADWLLQLRWAPRLRAARLGIGIGPWLSIGWGDGEDAEDGVRLDPRGVHRVDGVDLLPLWAAS